MHSSSVYSTVLFSFQFKSLLTFFTLSPKKNKYTMNSNKNQNFYKLPKITNPNISESNNYFKYGKNQIKIDNLNPNYNNSTSYFPYQILHQIDLDRTSFNKLVKGENMVCNRINNDKSHLI